MQPPAQLLVPQGRRLGGRFPAQGVPVGLAVVPGVVGENGVSAAAGKYVVAHIVGSVVVQTQQIHQGGQQVIGGRHLVDLPARRVLLVDHAGGAGDEILVPHLLLLHDQAVIQHVIVVVVPVQHQHRVLQQTVLLQPVVELPQEQVRLIGVGIGVDEHFVRPFRQPGGGEVVVPLRHAAALVGSVAGVGDNKGKKGLL